MNKYQIFNNYNQDNYLRIKINDLQINMLN